MTDVSCFLTTSGCVVATAKVWGPCVTTKVPSPTRAPIMFRFCASTTASSSMPAVPLNAGSVIAPTKPYKASSSMTICVTSQSTGRGQSTAATVSKTTPNATKQAEQRLDRPQGHRRWHRPASPGARFEAPMVFLRAGDGGSLMPSESALGCQVLSDGPATWLSKSSTTSLSSSSTSFVEADDSSFGVAACNVCAGDAICVSGG
mmetsp:Transcript_20469/g.57932  ORF Transcript_20469/g.57932 Transcript_20469/m.57932 type:complete len:204 (+) Transcript_20469:360-971(+)